MRRLALIASFAIVAIALCLPAGSSARVKQSFFHTLDGNISCAMLQDKKPRRRHGRKIPGFPGVARCDLQSHTWVAPPKPKSCPVDWGFGVEVTKRGTGRYVCAGDSVANPSAPALGPGATVTVGRYTCAVLATSVRCTNNADLHGFEVSAAQVALF